MGSALGALLRAPPAVAPAHLGRLAVSACLSSRLCPVGRTETVPARPVPSLSLQVCPDRQVRGAAPRVPTSPCLHTTVLLCLWVPTSLLPTLCLCLGLGLCVSVSVPAYVSRGPFDLTLPLAPSWPHRSLIDPWRERGLRGGQGPGRMTGWTDRQPQPGWLWSGSLGSPRPSLPVGKVQMGTPGKL